MSRWQWSLALLIVATGLRAAGGQVRIARASGDGDEAKRVPLVKTDFDVATWLEKARQRIEEKDYSRAIEILQAIVEGDSGFVPVDESQTRFIAMRVEATKLIGSMGTEGLSQYRQLYNARAERKLSDALRDGDLGGVEAVVATYLHTPAGQRALEAMGALHFDRGRFLQASRHWRRRLTMAEQAAQPMLLAKTAAALHLGGRTKEAADLRKRLETEHPEAEGTVAGQSQNLMSFVDGLLKRRPVASRSARQLKSSYPGWGGIPDGLAIMDRCEFVLLPQWQTETVDIGANIADKLAATDVVENMRTRRGQRSGDYAELRDGHIAVVKDPSNRSRRPENLQFLPPVIRPVVTDRWIIYRTDEQVIAVDRETGQMAWNTWEMLPLERQREQTQDGRRRTFYHGRNASFVDRGRYGLTLGGDCVYTVWDYPYDDPDQRGMRRPGGAKTSSLTALRLDMEGYAAWTVGHSGPDDDFKSAMFLSLPTYDVAGAGAGRLYVMLMETGNYYLACLDPHNRGTLLWKTEVAQPPALQGRRFPQIESLQLIGSPPAVADGRVFVTTNAGVIAAFDAETGKGLWAYQYDTALNVGPRRAVALPGVGGAPRSRVNPILVSRGVLVALPADSGQLIALNVDDGSPAWRRDVQAGKLDHLTALDADRFMLSGDGATTLRFKDGKQLADFGQVQFTRGTPAVTPTEVLLSGQGKIYRIDKSTYDVDSIQLAEVGGLLGNLVSADGQLFAANALGVNCYSSYELASQRLTDRMNQAEPLLKAELLFKRGHLAFVTKRFDRALTDFEACRNMAEAFDDELQRHAFLRQLGPRLYRAYVALGNVSDDRDVRLERFQQAMELAESKAEKLHMLVRMAKHDEDVGQFRKAIKIARTIRSEYGTQRMADVRIGNRADATVTITARATTHFGSQWADKFIRRLITVHGQDVYAPWDAEARAALDRAIAAGDPSMLQEIAERYPHSQHLQQANFRAAELYYRQAKQRSGKDAAMLGKARSILFGVASSAGDDASRRASAIVGLAAIDMASGVPKSAENNLENIADLPPDTPVSFADHKGSLKDVVAALREATVPDPAATGASLLPALPLTLEKIATIEDSSVILLADDRLRPIERDGVLFAVADKTMQFWPVDKLVAHAHDYEPRSIDIGNMASAARTARSNMNYPWAAGLSEDGSLLWLASAAEAVGVDIDEAKVVHRVTMQSLGLNNAAEVAMGEGVMIAMDSRGMIATMSLADGSRGWPSRIAVDHAREAMQSRFTLDAGCAVLLTNRHCDLHVFDIKSGKVIFSEQANVVAGAQFTPDDKLVVTVDDEITLREPKPEAIQTPLAGRVLETEDAAILLDVGTHYAVVALSRDGSQLRAIRLADLADGSGVSIRSQPLPSGGEGHPFAAMVDGQSIYVLSSKRPSMPRTLQNATARLDGGFGIARFKMPIGEQKWSRFVETNVDASCRVLPRNTTGQILVGLRATNPEKPGGWVLLEKANRNKPVRIDVASRSRRNRKAVLRQRQIGAAAIVDGRLIIETPTGLAIYGEK